MEAMGEYFSDKWAAISSLPAAIAENPVFFAIAFLIGLPLIWWKWRFSSSSVSNAIDSQTHGLRVGADSKQVLHETGIGTRDVLVMRPDKTPKSIYFALLFFGGGALFYWFIVLQSGAATSEDWWVFAVLGAFTICAMAVVELNLTRITVSDTTIVKKRVLHKRQVIKIAEISAIEPLAKQISRGAKLRASDGQVMRIGANFSGYKDLILRLKGITNA
jgi:hypothetical protein